jgi:hypothetical protein
MYREGRAVEAQAIERVNLLPRIIASEPSAHDGKYRLKRRHGLERSSLAVSIDECQD